jgi:phage baseplate assembly protein W
VALVLKKDLFTPSKKQPVYYSDIDAWFTPSYGLRDVGVYENVDAVKNSIRNIVLTNRGERFFNKEFGCDVRKMLFENPDDSTASVIKSYIETAIENFEPRAKILEIIVSPNVDLNAYTITLVFTTINSPDPQTLDLILTKVR